MKPAVVALLLIATFATAALAQEFGRVSGGEVDLAVKSPSKLSGSLEMGLPFFSGNGSRRYEASIGGTLLKDRLWFFGTAQQMDLSGFDAKLNAAVGERQSLDAALHSARPANNTSTATPNLTVPSSFLSLHYAGIISSNSFFTATFSRSSGSRTALTPFE